MSDSVDQRVAALLQRLKSVEDKLYGSNEVARVKADLLSRGVYSGKFITVQENYYDLSLEQRAQILNTTTQHLCKSIIFENTACDRLDCSDITNSRYYCLILQYEAKFDAELLRNVIHRLREPEQRLPRKRFHFQLASEESSYLLTGFGHNGVSPFGTLTNIPIVLCSEVANVKPSYIYLGGGDVNVKLGISIEDLIRSTNAIVGKVSDPRAVSETD